VKIFQLQNLISHEYLAFVQKEFSSRPLLNALLYSTENPGKLLRPLIMAVVAQELFKNHGSRKNETFPWGQLFPLMWAVELHHTYTLIHDDLPCMDNDDERRGRATVHKAFHESTAVLAGDALLGISYQLLAKCETHKLSELIQFFYFCTGAKGLVAGQLMDLEVINGKVPRPTMQEMIRIHELKTGRLFLFSFLAPLYLTSFDNCQINWKSLVRLASQVGLLFQVNDDEGDSYTGIKTDFGPNLFYHYPEASKMLQNGLKDHILAWVAEGGHFKEWKTLKELLEQYNLI